MEMLSKVACMMVMLCMVVISPHAQAAITCGQITSGISPCLGYLRSGGAVPPVCCIRIRSLNAAAKTTPDRQAACKCLKSAATAIKGINLGNAASLPGRCGVTIPYKISPSTDCSKVR